MRLATNSDGQDQVRKAFPAIQLFSQFPQAVRKIAYLPAFARQHLQQGLGFERVGFDAQGVSEAGRHTRQAFRRIGLPHPIATGLVKLAEQ